MAAQAENYDGILDETELCIPGPAGRPAAMGTA